MLSVLARRGVEACISAFAVLGFCYVPLGEHTGLEHAKAIFSTPAAKRAGGELMVTFARVQHSLTGEAARFAHSEAAPSASVAPSGRHGEGSRSERSHRLGDPSPRPPHLGSDSNAHPAPQEPIGHFDDPDAPDASVPWHES